MDVVRQKENGARDGAESKPRHSDVIPTRSAAQQGSKDEVQRVVREERDQVRRGDHPKGLVERGFGKPGVMHTWSGKHVNPTDFKKEDVEVRDIAKALSLSNRFNGHTYRPYSVAEHSLVASFMAPEEYRLEALLHDAGEAYIGDVITPVKEAFPVLLEYEDKITGIIFSALHPNSKQIRNGLYKKSNAMIALDSKLGMMESEFLRPHHVHKERVEQGFFERWGEAAYQVKCLRSKYSNELDSVDNQIPGQMYHAFLARYHELREELDPNV